MPKQVVRLEPYLAHFKCEKHMDCRECDYVAEAYGAQFAEYDHDKAILEDLGRAMLKICCGEWGSCPFCEPTLDPYDFGREKHEPDCPWAVAVGWGKK